LTAAGRRAEQEKADKEDRLVHCVKAGDIEGVFAILAEGSDITLESCANLAVKHHQPPLLKRLLRRGANLRDLRGNHLDLAQSKEMVRILVDHNCDVSWDPLQSSLHQERLDAAMGLVEAGAPLYTTYPSTSALHIVVEPVYRARRATEEQEKLELVDLLLQKGADVHMLNRDKRTPLHIAARGDWPSIVQRLLEAGSDVSAKDKNGLTPLERAEYTSRSRAVLTDWEQARDSLTKAAACVPEAQR